MKSFLKVATVAACVGWACVAVFVAQLRASKHQPDPEHAKWVARCLKDFQSIKVGMTRGEIEARLSKDGGLQGVSPVRFTHPACEYFKIDVGFEFKRDAADQNRAIESKDDKVTSISKPYIETPFAD